MNAYKTVLTIDASRQLIVQLPANFEGTEVEVIVLNMSDDTIAPTAKPSLNFRNRIQNPMKIDEIDVQLQTIRNEWQNNFS